MLYVYKLTFSLVSPEESLQRVGWQLGPAEADDEEKMLPQLTCLFTLNQNAFPENYTITSLSVHELVKHCYEVGYVKAGEDTSHQAQTGVQCYVTTGSNGGPNIGVTLTAASSMTAMAGATTAKPRKKQRNKKTKSDRADEQAFSHLV